MRYWNRHHYGTFVITLFSYALLHATRKTLSNVKSTLSNQWSSNNTVNENEEIYEYREAIFSSRKQAAYFLSTLDTLFLISYALGEFLSGFMGERFNLVHILSFGMCSSSITSFMFGTLSEWLHIFNYYWYIIFWSLTGLLQASGWPTVIAIIGNWFGKSSRGLVLGVFGISSPMGNIIGAYFVSNLLQYGYQYTFLLPSILTFIAGIVVFFTVHASPTELGFPAASEEANMYISSECLTESKELLEDRKSEGKPITFLGACFLPDVMSYSFSFACLKVVNFSLFFWLPYYLQETYSISEKEAVVLSIWYDVGGIIGCILGGWMTDKLNTSSPVVGFFLAFSPGTVYAFHIAPRDKVIIASLMTLMGIFLNGAANLISTSIASDLGRHCQKDESAQSTVTGIVNGTGSAGAALGQLIIPIFRHNWGHVFDTLIFLDCMAFVLISRVIYRDAVKYWKTMSNPPKKKRKGQQRK